MDFDREAHPLQPLLDGVGQIPLHVGFVSGVLRGAGDCHEFRQMIAETAGDEIGQYARRGAASRRNVTLLGSWASLCQTWAAATVVTTMPPTSLEPIGGGDIERLSERPQSERTTAPIP